MNPLCFPPEWADGEHAWRSGIDLTSPRSGPRPGLLTCSGILLTHLDDNATRSSKVQGALFDLTYKNASESQPSFSNKELQRSVKSFRGIHIRLTPQSSRTERKTVLCFPFLSTLNRRQKCIFSHIVLLFAFVYTLYAKLSGPFPGSSFVFRI